MKRLSFYKEYYQVTDRVFSDKICRSNESKEKARQKGKIDTSKIERKIYLALQYPFLLYTIIYTFIDPQNWLTIPVGLFILVICALITNFSFVKIECIYHIYKKDTAYTRMLYKIFKQDEHETLEKIRLMSNKKIRDFFHQSGRAFGGKYVAYVKDRNADVCITFLKDRVKILVNGNMTVIHDPSISDDELLVKISDTICEQLS